MIPDSCFTSWSSPRCDLSLSLSLSQWKLILCVCSLLSASHCLSLTPLMIPVPRLTGVFVCAPYKTKCTHNYFCGEHSIPGSSHWFERRRRAETLIVARVNESWDADHLVSLSQQHCGGKGLRTRFLSWVKGYCFNQEETLQGQVWKSFFILGLVSQILCFLFFQIWNLENNQHI